MKGSNFLALEVLEGEKGFGISGLLNSLSSCGEKQVSIFTEKKLRRIRREIFFFFSPQEKSLPYI